MEDNLQASSSQPTDPLPAVHAGFIPLIDCAPLIMARELGFDEQFGFRLELHREVSWANIRDKLDLGVFDCAQMLAPMPLAASLGLGRATQPIMAPMALSQNGNAITVSRALFTEMADADHAAMEKGGAWAAQAMAAVVRKRQSDGREPLTFGIVYPFSAHNYDLRYWLASAGIDPDNDVNLVVVPPPLIVASLASGRVDGCCVGEPWNSVAVSEGIGEIVATKSELWARSPEKVLGVRESWAEGNMDLLHRLIRALVSSASWLADPENRAKTATILARETYVGVAADILNKPLTGDMELGSGRAMHVDDMVLFQRGGATFPWYSHAIWFLTQMIRWGQVRQPFSVRNVAERVYRPDIYREAVAPLGLSMPASDIKRDDGEVFFDDATFDPSAPIDYIAQHPIRSAATDLTEYLPVNV